MKCRKTRLLLSEYSRGDLGRKEMSQVAEHIKHCSRCQEELSELKNLEERIKAPLDFKGITLSPQFEVKLRARIKMPDREKSGFAVPRWAFASGIWLVCVLLVSLAILFKYSDRLPSEDLNKTIARFPFEELETMADNLSESEESWGAADFTEEDILRTLLKDYPESEGLAIFEDESLVEMLEGLSPAEGQEIIEAVKSKLKV